MIILCGFGVRGKNIHNCAQIIRNRLRIKLKREIRSGKSNSPILYAEKPLQH